MTTVSRVSSYFRNTLTHLLTHPPALHIMSLFIAYLMKRVTEKITKGEISQDVFRSVTAPQIIEESTMTEKVTISEEAKISSEASNSLPKSVLTPADTNPRFKKAKLRKEASNSAKILKVTSNPLPKSASIPAATEAATNPRSDDALHDVPATFGHNKEKNEQDVTDRGGIEVSQSLFHIIWFTNSQCKFLSIMYMCTPMFVHLSTGRGHFLSTHHRGMHPTPL